MAQKLPKLLLKIKQNTNHCHVEECRIFIQKKILYLESQSVSEKNFL